MRVVLQHARAGAGDLVEPIVLGGADELDEAEAGTSGVGLLRRRHRRLAVGEGIEAIAGHAHLARVGDDLVRNAAGVEVRKVGGGELEPAEGAVVERQPRLHGGGDRRRPGAGGHAHDVGVGGERRRRDGERQECQQSQHERGVSGGALAVAASHRGPLPAW